MPSLAATVRVNVAAACDAQGLDLRPASVVIKDGLIAAIDRPTAIDRGGWSDICTLDRPRALLLPALVNAHAHLDLSRIPPRPFGGDFADWLKGVVADRPRDDDAIAAVVRQGLAMSRDAGVGWVGDIAGSVAAANARLNAPLDRQGDPAVPIKDPFKGPPNNPTNPATSQASGLPGVSYLECFGIGKGQLDGYIALKQRLARLAAPSDPLVRLGISPHAPYSAGLSLWITIARLSQSTGHRLCAHLAETPAETAFIHDAQGPLTEMLAAMGKLDDSIVAQGLSPVASVETALRQGDWLAVHCNEVDEADIRILAANRTSVVYCPAASAYFGLPSHGQHRYRQMLAAGINVCLGTDGLLCQPADVAQPLGILPQMQRLYQRDGTDPQTLLAMATVNGLTALGFAPNLATLQPGAPARFAAIEINPDDATDPLVQALSSDASATGLWMDLPAV